MPHEKVKFLENSKVPFLYQNMPLYEMFIFLNSEPNITNFANYLI